MECQMASVLMMQQELIYVCKSMDSSTFGSQLIVIGITGLTAAVGSFEGDTVGSNVVGLGVTGL